MMGWMEEMVEWWCRCQSCSGRRALVFCSAHAARLCLHCDAHLHHPSHARHHLHSRATLCDSCAAAPAHLRRAAPADGPRVALCRSCLPSSASIPQPAHAVLTYTGCPTPVEMVRLLSSEAPSPHDDFDAWQAHNKLNDHHHDAAPELASGGGGDAVAATLERFLAATDGWADTDTDTAAGGACAVPVPVQPQPEPAVMMPSTSSNIDSNNSISISKRREERERAKLRYLEKRSTRKFCREVMYASRKARADTRNRIKGRFAKASSTSTSGHQQHG